MTIEVGGAGGGLPRLAQDLTYLELGASSSTPYSSETIVMVAGVEKEIFARSGNYAIGLLALSSLVNESMRIRMLNDEVEIWDSTRVINGSSWALYNSNNGNIAFFAKPPFEVQSSISLLLTTTTDLSIEMNYTAVKKQ
jgi:hypothetical protein